MSTNTAANRLAIFLPTLPPALISRAIFSLTDTISFVAISVELEHTYPRDIEITLQPPFGEPIKLGSMEKTHSVFHASCYQFDITQVPGTGDSKAAPCELEWGGNQLLDGIAATMPDLTKEDFLVIAQMNPILGSSTQGVWELVLRDEALEDEGRLLNWSILLLLDEAGADGGETIESISQN